MELNKTYAVALLLFIFPIALSLENNGFRVELSHIDSKSNFTQIELLTRATARAELRLSRLKGMQLFSSANASSSVQYESSDGEYLMDLAIGNPPLNYSAILDTGSDLIWTQCTPCKKCVSQPTPLYDPSKSSTVSSVPCNSTFYQFLCATFTNYPPPSCLCSYNYTYGSGWTSGTLKRETFTFGTSNPVQFSSTVFGCSSSTSTDTFNGTSGLVGFGRGPLSLPSQLNTSMFSYCLGSFLNSSGKSTLFIGPWATFSGSDVKSTSFVKSPSKPPFNTFYYLSLLGISLGTTNLGIQPSVFALQSNGEGGLIIDSGTAFTRLVNNAYEVVQNAVSSIMTLHRVDVPDVFLGLCYLLPSGTSEPSMPDMTLHFEGADMVLPAVNYMVNLYYEKGDSLLCLAMHNSSGSMSILGNYQQQNFHILYDISKEVLSFAPASCDTI